MEIISFSPKRANFFEFFQDLIKVYNIKVDYVLKEEMFIFKHNNLKTPMEVVS